MADSKKEKNMTGAPENCVQCGKCFEVCPLLRATGQEEFSPRAKAFLAANKDSAKANQLASICLSCGRCEKLCSQGVSGCQVVSHLRAQHTDYKSWVWKQWMGKGKNVWQKAGAVAEKISGTKLAEVGSLGLMLKGLSVMNDNGEEGGLPECVDVSFPEKVGNGERVLLFSGCVGSSVRKAWQKKAVSLIHEMGFDLLDPYGKRKQTAFTCCGSTYGSAGLTDEQRKAATHNVTVWKNGGKPQIIVYCATCQKELLSYCTKDIFENREEAEEFKKSVIPLAKLLLAGSFVVSDSLLSGTDDSFVDIHYHRPCHMSAEDQDNILLAQMLGERLKKVNTRECCGFGGIMQIAAPRIAGEVTDNCWKFFAGDGADNKQLVVTGCSGCALRLQATQPDGFQSGHWLDLLRR